MNDIQNQALVLESVAVERLMQAAKVLIDLQAHTQPDSALALHTAAHDAVNVRVEVVMGAFPVIRIVTLDACDEEVTLLRRLDLQKGAKH